MSSSRRSPKSIAGIQRGVADVDAGLGLPDDEAVAEIDAVIDAVKNKNG